MTYTYCCVYSARLPMMDGETVRNMQSPNPKINFEILVHRVGFIIRMMRVCFFVHMEKNCFINIHIELFIVHRFEVKAVTKFKHSL